jgi:hypothetical protein
MPKGSVPRNANKNFAIKKKRYFEMADEREKVVPKKMRPSAQEMDKAQKSYFDAADYPGLFREAAPSKSWYNKKARAKGSNKLREGLSNMATGEYSKSRRTAKDVRSNPSAKRPRKATKAPVGKGGR